MKTKVGLMSVGFMNFRHDIALEYLKKTIENLKGLDIELVPYNEIVMDYAQMEKCRELFFEERIDMMILQIGTFCMGDMALEIINSTKHIPLYLWGFEDPIVENYNTIPLNSLTGFNMITSYLKRLKIDFSYFYGGIDNKTVYKNIDKMQRALIVKKMLASTKIGVIGTRVPGFFLSEVNQLAFKEKVGPSIEYYAVGECVNMAKAIDASRVQGLKEKLATTISFDVDEIALDKNLRVYLAIRDLCVREKIDIVSIKCWPEWQSMYDIAVCSVLSLLNDDHIMASCEGDVSGLVTMYIQNILTKKVPFFTDLVNISKKGILKGWHCGQGPTSLSKGAVKFCGHPTMKGYGVSVLYEMKLAEITMCKLSEFDNDYRLFMVEGETIEVDRKLEGTQTDIQLDKPYQEVLDLIVENGIEHHYSVVHQRISDDLIELCKWMKWTVIK